MDEEMAEIIGMCVGDGCISITKKYSEFALSGDMNEERTYYDNWVMPLLNRKLFVPLLGTKLKPKKYIKNGVYGVITFDKRVVNSLLEMGLESGPKTIHGIPSSIKSGNKEIKKRFLRGLFDTDGSITFEKNYTGKERKNKIPKISIASTSKKMIEESKTICKELGFSVMKRKPWKGKRDKNILYGFTIKRKKDIQRWITEIEFKSPKHTTKIDIRKAKGECPPYTRIKERYKILGMISSSAKLKSS